jgi:hypothetical protein
MPAEVVTRSLRMPRRARYLVPRGLPRRGEFLAACAVVIIGLHVLFAQLTLVIAVACYLTGKATRWRASWLLLPAAAAIVWMLAVGPGAAAAGFIAGPAQIVDYLTAAGHLLHPGAAFAGAGNWLPRQLPLAILAGAAEAALASWLSWLHTDEWDLPQARPGLLVAVRRAAAFRSMSAGRVVTRDGCCVGVAPASGSRVTVSWPELEGGALICGSAGPDLRNASLRVVHAALRRRKPVLAVDFTGDPGMPGQLTGACTAAGVPLQVLDLNSGASYYEPFRSGDPADRAALVAGMLNWDGPGSQHRRSCVAYLADVFELLDAVPGDPRVPVLDEVIHLLDPAALQARAGYVPVSHPRHAVLAERTRMSASIVTAEPVTTAAMLRQLRALRASGTGRYLGQPVGRQLRAIDLSRTVSERTAVLFRLGGPEPGLGGPDPRLSGPGTDAAAMLTRLVCQDMLQLAARQQAAGVPADGVIVLAGCEAMAEQTLRGLFAAGSGAGLAVLATTTSGEAACALAEQPNVLLVHRMTDQAAARRLAAVMPGGGEAAEDLQALADGEFMLAVSQPGRLVKRALAGVKETWRPSGSR